MLNAFSESNIEDMSNMIDNIPDIDGADFNKLEANTKDLNKLNLEEAIAKELNRDYSDDDNGVHMMENYGDFIDGLSDISAEHLEKLEKLDEEQLSVLNNIENYIDSIPEVDYGIEEGLNELEEKMC